MQKRNRRAFTLIEMLVVIIIIATLATGVVLTIAGKPGEARIARAKADISTYETAVGAFQLDMRRYPNDDEGLEALVRRPDSEDGENWKGPYIKAIAKDPWGNPYLYVFPGYYNTESFDLMSYGADGQEGGDGDNMDIGNWIEEESLDE